MRIPRVFEAQLLEAGSIIELSESASHHLTIVLRCKINDPVILFNGDGFDFLGKISQIKKKSIQIELIEKNPVNKESPLNIHLGQAISRGEKMDWVIQKAVELGVREITPLFTQYCSVSYSNAQIEKKSQHWQAVIISACEQSGRSVLPILHVPKRLSDWLEEPHSCGLVFDPDASKTLKSLSQKPSSLSLLIGPEGGLSEAEIAQAKQKNFIDIQFGPRILRTETAALSAIAVVEQLWGDL